jgi:polar amino acid transport system substrate-binding protein
VTMTLSVNPAAARAISLTNDGIDDGLAARIGGLEKDYPNLVQVPEPIFVNDFVACTNAVNPQIKTWRRFPSPISSAGKSSNVICRACAN